VETRSLHMAPKAPRCSHSPSMRCLDSRRRDSFQATLGPRVRSASGASPPTPEPPHPRRGSGKRALASSGVALSCPHLPACPGCPRFGAAGPSTPTLQQLAELCLRNGAQQELEIGARTGFRHRARLAVRGRAGRPKIGIFAEGSHRVVDIPSCQIHHPLINEVGRALKVCMRELGSSCYSDGAHAGLVRALQVAVERSSQSAQIMLVCNDQTPAAALPLLDRLRERLGERVHSTWWNGNAEVTNRILGGAFHHHSGPASLMERIGGAQVYFPPAAFGQNNLDLFERMVARIHAHVPPGSELVELYAGCGAIGLGLAASCARLVFNEISPASLEGLALGVHHLPAEQRSRVRVVPGPAPAACPDIQPESVVIVDPPRKGLEPEVLHALGERRPRRLLYLSCDLGSLLRDAEPLIASGLKLVHTVGYDAFPYTEHIETLAIFQRD